MMKGPKAILSEAIAKALGEYFLIDPKDIETNLVSDAGVTLHHVQLKPIESLAINQKTQAAITGTVSSVSFHWQWGSEAEEKGGSGWIKDAQLSIRGLKFAAVLNRTPVTVGAPTDVESSETTGHPPAKTGKLKGYVQDQVNRVIDAITLSITDFEFRIEISPRSRSALDEQEAVVFGGSGVHLESLGRHMEELKQTLTIQSMFSNVVSRVGVTMPLLEPISYTATCVRCGGKRFDGGIATGLRVVGESIDNGVVVHAGSEQMLFLNLLGGMLLEQSTSTAVSIVPTHGEEIEAEVAEESGGKAESCEMHSTSFELPLAALSIVLPNESKISMAGLRVRYKMDGSLMTLEGTDGFKVNGYPLLAMGKSCMWQVNAVDCKFRILSSKDQSAGSIPQVATVHARDDEIEKIQDGIQGLVDIYHAMQTQGALASISSSDSTSAIEEPTQDEDSSIQWSFSVIGRIGFLLEDVKGDVKVDCTLQNLMASMAQSTASIGMVEKLYIPGFFRLKEPVVDATLSFDGTLFDFHVGDIVAILEEPPEQLKSENTQVSSLTFSSTPSSMIASNSGVDDDASPPAFALPFGGKVTINNVTIFKANGEAKHTSIRSIQFAMGPDVKQYNGSSNDGFRVALIVEQIHHDMIRLGGIQVSSLIHAEDLNSIQDLEFGAHTIAVSSGYSVFDWKRLFETGDEKRESQRSRKVKDAPAMKLPNAHVSPLKVNVLVKSNVVGVKDSTINIREFVGTNNTDVNDLRRFYTSAVIKSVPEMVTNADLIGFNLYDSVAGHVGTSVGTTALAGLGGAAAPVAGVLGIVGFDTINKTITAGKKNREAEPDDKMHAMDFFRGIGQAANDAAQCGAKKRGKSGSEKTSAVDWAVGATSNVAGYTNKNKSRLGGAGAGTAGFAYGMILGGPVGALAGAFIANKTTSHTIDVVEHRFSKKKQPVAQQNSFSAS